MSVICNTLTHVCTLLMVVVLVVIWMLDLKHLMVRVHSGGVASVAQVVRFAFGTVPANTDYRFIALTGLRLNRR